jgi:hypothetical protein
VNIPTVIIEISVTGAVVWLARNAFQQGHRWLATLLWGIVFGFLVEWWNTTHPPCPYTYPCNPLSIACVPLWVPIGWGGIIYAGAWTAQRLRLPLLARPGAAALLAVNLDLTLDPVAQALGFWNWSKIHVTFFEVPFNNFLAWYMVVSVYALCSRGFLRLARWVLGRRGDGRTERDVVWVQYAGPFGGATLAFVVILVVKGLVGTTSGSALTGGSTAAVIFVVITVLAVGLLATGPSGSRNQAKVNWPVILVPVFIHAVSFALFLGFGEWTKQPALLAVIPMNMIAGAFLFALPSLGPIAAKGPRN